MSALAKRGHRYGSEAFWPLAGGIYSGLRRSGDWGGAGRRHRRRDSHGRIRAERVEEPIELEAQTVTGSRLAMGDATARVYSITAEDIKRLGVSNVEDLMRTLPWTYASITQQTSALENSALAPPDVDKNLRAVDNLSTGLLLFEVITGFGTSTANLRAWARPTLWC